MNHGVISDCTILCSCISFLILEGERGVSHKMGSLMTTKEMFVEETLNVWEALLDNMEISMLFHVVWLVITINS